MEYIDWIMSSAIFFLVLIGVISFLPNYIPINRVDYDSIAYSNVFNTITEVIPTYAIINPNNDGEIYPYSINLDENVGRSNSSFVIDNNVVYGIVSDKNKFYNFDANTDYNLQSNNLVSVSSIKRVYTDNLDINITNANVKISLFKDTNQTMDFNLVFTSTLTVTDTNNISIIKNPSAEKRLIVFPQAKEFWSYIPLTEDINLSMDNSESIGANNYSYYIEDDNTNKYIWTKVNLDANQTKTIYITKTNGYSPDGNTVFFFFDDFNGTTLDLNKWQVIAGSAYSVSNSLRINTGGISVKTAFDVNLESNYIVKLRATTINNGSYYGGTLPELASSRFVQGSNGGSDATILPLKQNATSSALIFVAATGSTASYNITNGEVVLANPIDYNTFNNYDLYLRNTTFQYFRDGISLYNSASITWAKNLKYLSLGYFTNGNADIGDMNYLYLFIRKYTANEPTITVTSINSNTYKVEIKNNEANPLTNYQVRIPNTIIGVTSKSTSLNLSDSLLAIYVSPDYNLGIKQDSLKLIGRTNKFLMLNAFDNFGNKTDCNFYSIDENKIGIKDCNTNAIIKFRFREGIINQEYPKIRIIKTKERMITSEKIDFLSPTDYYLSLTSTDTNIEKGINRNTFGKIFVNYSKYLSSDGIEKIVKVYIKPN